MRKIEAIIRQERMEQVKYALAELGYIGLTVTEVKGRGRQGGIKQIWRGRDYPVDLLPKVKVEVVVPRDRCREVAGAIVEAARTGEVGDGKIFIIPVETAIRVRTGEKDQKAL